MKVIHCAQGSREWFEARLGRVTGSEVAAAVCVLKVNRSDRKKGDEGKTRANYKASIVSEILTGIPADTFVSKYMSWGTEQEIFARTEYEMKFDVDVKREGFVIHPSIERSGASPDGLVGKDGGLEIKAPKTETHLGYMKAGILPPEYEPQVMWNIACAEREWWDFLSYDPRLPERHQMFCLRVFRDEARIKELERGVSLFLEEVDEYIAHLNTLNPEPDQLKKQLRASLEEIGELGITDADLPPWWREVQPEDPDHDIRPLI